MDKKPSPAPPLEPVADAAKGLPDNGRSRTERVLEKGLPPDQQRRDRTEETPPDPR